MTSDYYTILGPELFTNGDVISYKGENYYRACDYPVAQVGESQTHCVKRVGHPSHVHEDYDGRLAFDIFGENSRIHPTHI